MASKRHWVFYIETGGKTAKEAESYARKLWKSERGYPVPRMSAELSRGSSPLGYGGGINKYKVYASVPTDSSISNPRTRKNAPRVRTRVVRKNSTTIKGYKSVTVKKLPDGRVQVTGRK